MHLIRIKLFVSVYKHFSSRHPHSAGETRTMRFTLALLASLSLSTLLAAQNQLAPPPGWTTQISGNAIIFNAPGFGPARPALTILPPGHPQGDPKTWFGNQVLTMAQAAGKILA